MKAVWIKRFRRSSQLIALTILVLIPWLDIIRLDLINGGFVIARTHFPVNQLYLLVIGFVFSIVLLALFARTFGRLFCGWACPQTGWSELGGTITTKIQKWKKMKRFNQRKVKLFINIVVRILFAIPLIWLFYSVLVSYFVAPQMMVSWLSEGFPIWFTVLGVKFSVFAFIDLLIIRHSFCHSICPYGLLQKFVQKNKSYKVTFDPNQCVDCNLCDMACPMDLYPRNVKKEDSCISCQECVVACGTRAESYQQKGRDFGTENCLAMSFRPFEPTLKEKFDKVSYSLLGGAFSLAIVFALLVMVDNGLQMKLTPMSVSQVSAATLNETEHKQGFQLEISNNTKEEKDFVVEVRSDREDVQFIHSCSSTITVPPGEILIEEVVVGLQSENVEYGRFNLWLDVYHDGEVVDSLRGVFYYQP